jgi:hypothetical protein
MCGSAHRSVNAAATIGRSVTQDETMNTTFKTVLILTAVCANSVVAAPIMPEGLVGVTQETMIDRSLVQNSDLLLVGDDRYLQPHYLPLPNPGPINRRSRIIHGWVGDDEYPVKQPPRYDDSAALPASCAREYFTNDIGWANYFGARCLEESYCDAHYLPQACAMTIRTEGRLRDVYDEYCLRQAGYTMSGW